MTNFGGGKVPTAEYHSSILDDWTPTVCTNIISKSLETSSSCSKYERKPGHPSLSYCDETIVEMAIFELYNFEMSGTSKIFMRKCDMQVLNMSSRSE
ncbi:hypothetical protein DASC09_045260 [Saccharomycopsis crataegensis]|uniref:Uncharacterized protein n=1 Tax=Saccharomycopsis crataegensis TaxID=43959 RepID=A0AAV5QRI2_9ASCO|nr:hypothetical protein DASC09_045260 [Saccharomycopsis crataegensis]